MVLGGDSSSLVKLHPPPLPLPLPLSPVVDAPTNKSARGSCGGLMKKLSPRWFWFSGHDQRILVAQRPSGVQLEGVQR